MGFATEGCNGALKGSAVFGLKVGKRMHFSELATRRIVICDFSSKPLYNYFYLVRELLITQFEHLSIVEIQ